jgi:mannose-6-phosphate isomerase
MATSDNVVRAGLTPKFQDTVELLAMADVTPGKTITLEPVAVQGSAISSSYKTPASEFHVLLLHGKDEAREEFSLRSASVVLCTSGRMQLDTPDHSLSLDEGQAAIIPAACNTFSITLRKGRGFLASVPNT